MSDFVTFCVGFVLGGLAVFSFGMLVLDLLDWRPKPRPSRPAPKPKPRKTNPKYGGK